jgi:hypothetical protein
MPKHHLDAWPSGNADGDAVSIELREFEAVRHNTMPSETATNANALTQIDREQFARDIAEIESATAALRKGEPALESWTSPSATTIQTPRPLWVLIGVLWLSTALVAAGAVVAIVTFVG